MRKLYFLTGGFIISWLSGCDCFTSCYLSPQFAILDRNTQEDLITGPNPRYYSDSLMQRKPSDSSFIHVFDNRLLFNDTVYLQLNSTDVDTVVVYYNKAKGDRRCCGGVFYEPQAVFYNGVACGYHGNIFLFEK